MIEAILYKIASNTTDIETEGTKTYLIKTEGKSIMQRPRMRWFQDVEIICSGDKDEKMLVEIRKYSRV
jgi:hypothetical protein